MFKLAVWTGLLTVLTLGFYRFWMKTRLRRWYWSAVRPGGQPLEYTGEPLEKLLGFLIAVVFLAFYLGVVNLLLMFVSFSLLSAPFGAYGLSFLGVFPLWFYATYRSRRYVLARSRWRGVRFGLEPGAWGYAFRAMWHWALTIVTLGALWPRMTFWLEKYITDRTQFGTMLLHQGGQWTMLYPATAHALIGGVFSLAAILLGAAGEEGMFNLVFLTGPWLAYGVVHYRVTTKRLLANHKTAGKADTKQGQGAVRLGLLSAAQPARVFAIRLFGTFGVACFVMLPLIGLAMALVITDTFGQVLLPDGTVDVFEAFGVLFSMIPRWASTSLAVLFYFFVFLMWAVLNHVWVTMPIWRHYAMTLTITGASGLDSVTQRPRDTFAEAEGFAEALDVGAAI